MRNNTIAFVLAFALLGCSKSPSDVLAQIEEAARAGDDEAFASHFTEESAPFARALLSVYHTQAPAGSAPSRPLAILTTSTVVEERIEGDTAYLKVKAGPAAANTNIIVFVREGGEWKLDVMKTERENAGRE